MPTVETKEPTATTDVQPARDAFGNRRGVASTRTTSNAVKRLPIVIPPRRRRRHPVWIALLVGSGLALSGGLVWIAGLYLPQVDGAAAGPKPAQGSVEVKTDEQGRVVEVSGFDPVAVLLEFCKQRAATSPCESLHIAAAVPPRAGVKLGIFREHDAAGGRRAIEIRRRGGVRVWTAGDGSEPIEPPAAPDLPAGAQVYPVASAH